MARHWIWLRLLQILIDSVLVYISFLLAYFLRVGWIFSTDFPFEIYWIMALLATFLWIGFLIFTKYYRIPPRSGKRAWFDAALAIIGGIVSIGFLIVLYFFPRDVLFSRLIGIYALGFGVIFLFTTQWAFRLILALQKKKEKHVYRAIIVGANRVAEKIIESISNDAYAPYKIIGVIDPYGMSKKVEGAPILGKLNRLEDICKEEKITALIQCDGFEHTINLISLCEEYDIKFQFNPSLRGIYEENLRIRETAGKIMISFVQRQYKGNKKTAFKFVDFILRQVFDVD